MDDSQDSLWSRVAVLAILFCAVFVLSYHTLGMQTIEGLDPAHTIMDGLYFRDLIIDHPLNPISYTLSYYRQYPALGFLFWPPFFPFVLGLGFLVGGLDIRVAHWCLFGLTFLMVWMAYLIARRRLPQSVSVLAALLIVTTPIIGQQANIIMREVPALALLLTTIYAYQRFVESTTWTRGILLALASTAALNTKQTVVVVFPVLALDLWMNHRELLKNRRVWVTAALMFLLALPLAVFTIGFSKINVEASLGSDRSFILSDSSPARWTIEAWTFYPRVVAYVLGPVVMAFGLLGLIYGFVRREFFRRNALWFGWVLIWLAVFTFVLNKQARHAIVWLPGWCMLAAAMAAELRRWNPQLKHLQWALLIPVFMGGLQIIHSRPPAYLDLEPLVSRIMQGSPTGNVMYFGRNRQAFVPFIRIKDGSRRIYTLQGDDLTATETISEACRDYRVSYILAEQDDPDFQRALAQMKDSGSFSDTGPAKLHLTWRAPIEMRLIRYTGPLAAQMKTIQLKSRLATAKANEFVNK